MPSEVKAQDTMSLASVKTVNEAATQSRDLLAEMQAAAQEAGTTLDGIYQDAADAQQAANTAFNHLAVVENIVGVLSMVAEHGEYSENPSTDTTVQPEKWYFVRSGSGTAQDPYTYEIVQNAQDDYIYFLTEDTEIVEGKTYYTRSGSGTEQDPYVYTPVENPDVQYISTYYERTNSPNLHGWYELVGIDEAIQNYVINHLALDNAGLWLQSDGAAKILLSTTSGIVLYDDSNNELASYGSTTVIGNKQDFHIEIGRYYALTADEAIVQDKTYYTRTGTYPNYVYTEVQSPDVSEISTYYELMAPQIGFYQGENKVAYMGSSELYVENNLSFGNFVFTQRNNGHFTLKLID